MKSIPFKKNRLIGRLNVAFIIAALLESSSDGNASQVWVSQYIMHLMCDSKRKLTVCKYVRWQHICFNLCILNSCIAIPTFSCQDFIITINSCIIKLYHVRPFLWNQTIMKLRKFTSQNSFVSEGRMVRASFVEVDWALEFDGKRRVASDVAILT